MNEVVRQAKAEDAAMPDIKWEKIGEYLYSYEDWYAIITDGNVNLFKKSADGCSSHGKFFRWKDVKRYIRKLEK
jgi:hypothetical protein